MKYIKDTLEFHISEPSVITLGKFDGLHSGHRYLMEEMRKGKQDGLKCVAFTFDIPPRAIHDGEYKVLSTNEEKVRIFEEAGVDYLIECPFTDELRQMSPRQFLKMLTDRVHVKRIVAGTDFCFGYKRSGTYRELRQYAKEFSYEAVIVKKKQYKEQDISSTRIRECIEKGEMEEANLLLGYDYFVTARVEKGNRIGRTIGFPTANQIPPKEKLLPPNGVYATRVLIEGKQYNGISNIGNKPTIRGEYPIGIETNVFGFNGNIYGQNIQVSFLKYIRPERKFESLAALTSQVNRDKETCISYFLDLA